MIPPTTAMLLAAGLGTRMRPLTERAAKPLLPLGGRPLLDHALDRLAAAGVERVVVNAHWHADRVARISPAAPAPPAHDPAARGGAARHRRRVAAALAELGPDPFFVVNGDTFWLDGPTPGAGAARRRLGPTTLDAVLLVHRTFQVHAEVGAGDFAVDPWGRVRRRARARDRALRLCRRAAAVARACSPTRRRGAVQHEPAVGPRDRSRAAARRGA